MTQSLQDFQELIKSSPQTTMPTGARYLTEFIGQTDGVRYTAQGIQFEERGRLVEPPQPNEVLIKTTSVSLCGTDLALIDKAHQGELPAEAIGKVVGHEAAGFIVGVGSEVKGWEIGQFVCLDSHFSCSQEGHNHFDDCVQSGKGCDGIVGGIRGVLDDEGQRTEPPDGYWSRVIAVPASALPIELPLEIATHLKAPSTLESLGNIYMMVVKMKQEGLLDNPERTLCLVVGLGATGYPMAAVASHYGFRVVGINPSEWKRQFALEQGACQVAYAGINEATSELEGYDRVVVIVTADHPSAHEQALNFLETEAGGLSRRVAIIFGLFADPKKPMPGAPPAMANLPQRDFVFSRHQFKTDSGVEVYGVCGRDLESWQMLMADLQPDADGQSPNLARMLNEAQFQPVGEDPLLAICEALNQGSKHIENVLTENRALKLVANLLK
jgi:threonine dehydrogenase-like Zn-dependent dehydrogenase